ncbi:MAG: winged helix-turn-helix transcriptional regulator [Bacteroidia bacterium]|nr:winged helix-turn-helix transcriptional regulator [Bacteroidia bacterium]
MSKRIMRLIAAGENEVLDFKREVSNPNKIAKTMVSFANHKGGRLLVGVDDEKKIRGVNTDEEIYMLEKAAGFFCKPMLDIAIKEWTFGKKSILEVTVPDGSDKPYYAQDEKGKWWVHIRVKDQSLLASKVVVDVLRKQTKDDHNVISYSSKEKFLLNYLDQNDKITLKEYCAKLNLSRKRATKILVNLISMGIVRVHSTEKFDYYTLS